MDEWEPSSMWSDPRHSWHTRSIAQLLGVGGAMRSQNPGLKKTDGKNPRWYIRPYLDRLQPDGSLSAIQERVYLGACADLTKRQALAEASRALAVLNDR